MATIGEALNQALDHHRAGRLAEAEALYRNILATRADHPDATHLLGVIRYQQGRHGEAVPLIEKAIALNPKSAAYHKNLGSAYQGLGRTEDAIRHHKEALRLDARYHEAHHGLAECHRSRDEHAQAAAAYRRALEIAPDFIHSMNGLAISLAAVGNHEEAEKLYRRAIGIKSDFAEAHVNLANLLKLRGRRKEAEAHFEKALALQPRSLPALVNLGNLYKDEGRIAEAIGKYKDVLALQPGFAPAHNNLANLYKDRGESAEALEQFRLAIRSDPTLVDAHSNLLLGLHYTAEATPEEIYREHLAWARAHADPLQGEHRLHANDPDPERRIRIGYVSPDFRRHPVAYFMEPVLENHDRARFEIVCYANVERPDPVTKRLREKADLWRDLRGVRDDQAAALARRDGIDILVDLAGHTAFSRMRMFARKPAPVQVSWLGYPNTTGLAAMDYRLSDTYADPPGPADRLHTERIVRLPHGFHCFRPPAEAPEPGPLPMAATGHPTFASFNMLSKVTKEVVAAWSRILAALPEARFVLKAPPLADAETRAHFARLFEAEGIAAERVEMLGYLPDPADHLALYNRIDLALDTFPYNGATTTCEALWMGVPVVSFAGANHVARVGLSLLSNLGLDELVARDADGYVELARALARTPDRIAGLRGGLRARMNAASLLDGPGFTRDLEAAYRTMWESWCAWRVALRAAQSAQSAPAESAPAESAPAESASSKSART
ncbi:MAG: tetratricopeptide repeat protein [Rhodospirillaceae bacterium]|jgi:protein O-GlcNAc transferase|nr:tetratricopeptide repeat protein [Rhodospirillaceae bacterium]